MARNSLKDATVIVTFPGIGNVGSITANYILKNSRSKPIIDMYSKYMPAVLISDGSGKFNLPKISGSVIISQNKKVVFYVGDAQPPTEAGVYKLSKKLVENLKANGARELIILGGIGLEAEPENPKTYFITNDDKLSNSLKRSGIDSAAVSKVNVVLGTSGVLFGIAKQKRLKAAIILAETCGAPGYMGLNATKSLVEALSSYLGMKIDTKDIKGAISAVKKESHSADRLIEAEETTRHYIG